MNKPTPGPWKNPGFHYTITGPGCAWGFSLTCSTDEMRVKAEKNSVRLVGPGTLSPEADALLALLPKDEDGEANAALIVAAVNACFAVNPDNPMVVAEALPSVVQNLKYALQIIEAFHVEIRGDERIPRGFCQGKIFVEWPEELRAALAKIEAKP